MPGGRPSKPLALVQGHRTKEEKNVRQKAEQSLLTGVSMKEWPDIKNNEIAHKEFIRIKKLLKSIDKDDALHESIINRYCLLIAECKEFEKMKTCMFEEIKQLVDLLQEGKIDEVAYISEKGKLQDRIMACDKKIMEKRKMMLDIEKENIMTIQSALRSIPKKEQKKEESPMQAFLNRKRAEGNGT